MTSSRNTSLYTWAPLTEDGSVRWMKYSFGLGTANSLAFRHDDGTWTVVSPSKDGMASVFDEFSRNGSVSALVAPNAYHHVGQRTWRHVFPGATSYAPEGAHFRLGTQSPGIAYRSTADLLPRLPAGVELFLPEGMKRPDLLIRITVRDKTIWWLGDLFSNNAAHDQTLPLRVISRFFGSGLGYRRNAKPGLVYVDDARAWLRSIRNALGQYPPSIVIPAHGDPVVDDAARRTQDLLKDL